MRDYLIRRYQDKYIDIFRLQESVADARGKLEQDQDFRMAEELFYGKAAERLEQLDNKTNDVVTAIREAKLNMDQVDEYLYAMHAKERNARLKETEGIENGSGMTDADADNICTGPSLLPFKRKWRRLH